MSTTIQTIQIQTATVEQLREALKACGAYQGVARFTASQMREYAAKVAHILDLGWSVAPGFLSAARIDEAVRLADEHAATKVQAPKPVQAGSRREDEAKRKPRKGTVDALFTAIKNAKKGKDGALVVDADGFVAAGLGKTWGYLRAGLWTEGPPARAARALGYVGSIGDGKRGKGTVTFRPVAS